VFLYKLGGAHGRGNIQQSVQLISMFKQDFQGYEEPAVPDFVEPYLPSWGVNDEMVRNGQGSLFCERGSGPILSRSVPCRNRILGEAVYRRVSRGHAGIPIRNFWFDGTPSDSERVVGIFGVFAKSQRRHKPWLRQPPLVSQSVCA
jgi:hypothetical protein